MQKKKRVLSFWIATTAFCLSMALFLSVARQFSNASARTIGPYKMAALAALGVIFLLGVDSYLHSFQKRILFAWTAFLGGTLWFSAIAVLEYGHPENTLALVLKQWDFCGFAFFLAGFIFRFFPFGSWAGIAQREKIYAFLLTVYLAISFAPILSAAYSWDDAFFSSVIPAMRITGDSIWARVLNEIAVYARMGRINPFATFQFLTFYFLSSRYVYKAFILLLTLTDCFLFYKFIFRWTRSKSAATLTLLILPLCVQFRLYHDSMSGYYGLMQTMFAEMTLALLFLLRFLDEKRKKDLAFSLLFFTIPLLSYEMAFPLIPLYFAVIISRRKTLRKSFKLCSLFSVIELFLLCLSFFLRANPGQNAIAYAGVSISPDCFQGMKTWLWQSVSAFPMTYQTAWQDAVLNHRLIQPAEIFGGDLIQRIGEIDGWDIVLLSIFVALIFSIANEKDNAKSTWLFPIFGLLLIVMPGFAIALSVKYQGQLKPGLAYIPVFFEYFGAAMILGDLFHRLIAFTKKPLPIHVATTIFCALFASILLFNRQNNRQSIEWLNRAFLYPRQVGEAAIQAGLLDDWENDFTLLSLNDSYLWEEGWEKEPYQSDFFSFNAGKPIKALGVSDFASLNRDQTYVTPPDTYLISYGGGAKTGFAKFGKLMGITVHGEKGTPCCATVSEPLFFIYGEEIPQSALITYRARGGELRQMELGAAWLIQRSDKGALYKLNESQAVYFNSINLAGNF